MPPKAAPKNFEELQSRFSDDRSDSPRIYPGDYTKRDYKSIGMDIVKGWE